jgi:hypothetical protein
MSEEKKEEKKVKTVYYIGIGGNEYVATYDKTKALELWNLLEEKFFRIAKVGSSYLYDSDLGKRREKTSFLYEATISEEGGITLKTLQIYLYPDELSASKAKTAFDKMQEAGERAKAPKDMPF